MTATELDVGEPQQNIPNKKYDKRKEIQHK